MTWIPKTKEAEMWTSESPSPRVFDPYVFDNDPIYDTGSAVGIWTERTKQSEIWTEV